MCLSTTACNFSSLIWPHGSAPTALARLLFDLPEPQIIGKTQCLATFLPFRAPGPSFFSLFLFLILFLLLFSSLTLPISAFHLSILSEVWLLNFLRLSIHNDHSDWNLGTVDFTCVSKIFFWIFWRQVLNLLAEIGTKEVVKNGKFSLPGGITWCQTLEFWFLVLMANFGKKFYRTWGPEVGKRQNPFWRLILIRSQGFQSDMVHRQNPRLVKLVLHHDCSSVPRKHV